jgi:phospholipid/cholesterol/gamma-HCH transport system substrate-binding protein
MLRRVDTLGQVGSEVLLTSREDLIADLRALRPVLQSLGESTPELIELIGFVPTFPFPDSSIPATVGGAANIFLSVDATISETLRNLGANQGEPVVRRPNTTSGPYVVDPQNPWVGDNGPDRRTTIVLPLLPVPPVMDRAVVPKPAPGVSEFSENYLPEPGEPGNR